MHQLSINLPPDVFEFVQKAAERETRPVSMQIRHYCVEAMRKAGGNPAQKLEAWPPPTMTVSPDNLKEARAQVAEMQAEYDRLREIERKSPTGLLPDQDERLRFCRDRIDALQRQIRPIEKMVGARA